MDIGPEEIGLFLGIGEESQDISKSEMEASIEADEQIEHFDFPTVSIREERNYGRGKFKPNAFEQWVDDICMGKKTLSDPLSTPDNLNPHQQLLLLEG